MKSRYWIPLTALAFLGLAILIVRPVPIPKEEDCQSLKGTVTGIYEAGVKDVVFKLQGEDKEFYINRGLETGLELEKLRADLINKEIRILYPKYWTPLDPLNSFRHISKLEYQGKIIYSEID